MRFVRLLGFADDRQKFFCRHGIMAITFEFCDERREGRGPYGSFKSEPQNLFGSGIDIELL